MMDMPGIVLCYEGIIADRYARDIRTGENHGQDPFYRGARTPA